MIKLSREYWILIGIFILFLIAVKLALFIQITKGVISASGWVFTFLDDWSLVLAAAATFLLAAAAFWAIMDNRDTRRKERKERLLNEIIEWAERILLCGVGETVREGWAQLSDEQKTEKSFSMRRGLEFMDIRDKGISIVYKSSFDTDLKSHTDSTMKLLQKHIDKWAEAKDGKIKDWRTITDHKSELDKSARQLIKKATALMCKGI